MLAARFHRYGPPAVLEVEEAPEPHADDSSVRIRVEAASVNPIDVLLRAGALRDVLPLDLPAIPGRDAVGVVDEVGRSVRGTRVGDHVYGLGGVSDTTAQFAVLTAWAAVPDVWTVEQAAAAGLASATAAGALQALGDVAGRTLLVEGAAGAVGGAVAALALAAGADVIGTARAANHGRLAAMGVRPVTYGTGLAQRVRELLPGGVDAAVHAAPSRSLPEMLDIVGDAGQVVTVVGNEDAARLGIRIVNARNDSALLDYAADVGGRGRYAPRVDHVVPLSRIAEAHTIAESGGGKVVVSLG